jgi:hypothetical protein
MTPTEVRKRVREIRRNAKDDEIAHELEDALRRDVLTAIAKGAKSAPALAREALRSTEIDFSRWCA